MLKTDSMKADSLGARRSVPGPAMPHARLSDKLLDLKAGSMSPSARLPLIQKHMPELDVLRGVAILAVLLYHGFYWQQAVSSSRWVTAFYNSTVIGWLGVNLFFVLSGFLITGILVDSKGKSSYYGNFYRRRALRILPAYLAVLLVLVLLGAMTYRSFAVDLLFLANYSTYLHATNYGVLWSLSVEEQFYLFWPALVANVSKRVLAFVSLLICLVEPLLRWLSVSGTFRMGEVHSGTHLIADNLALGALAALFARSRFGTRGNGVRLGLALCASGALVFVLGVPFGILHRTTLTGAAFQTVPWNLLFTGVLLLALGLRSPVASSRWTSPLRFLGYISYGLYLVHLLIFQAYDAVVAHLFRWPGLQHGLQAASMRCAIALTVSVLVAWASRSLFEEPFLRMGRSRSKVAGGSGLGKTDEELMLTKKTDACGPAPDGIR